MTGPVLPAGWPTVPRRFREQRWLVDAVIKTHGVDWDQGRTRYLGAPCGPGAQADFAAVREGVRSFADIDRVFARAAAQREAAMDEALAGGDSGSARYHGYVAAILWGAAEWPFFESPARAAAARAANERKLGTYEVYRARAPHEIRALAIEVGQRTFSALLHLPPERSGPVPCVLHIGGMDSFKEHAVAVADDRYLRRGIARLVMDGPGQGEAIHRGDWVTATNWIDAGRAALERLATMPEIDTDRLGVSGVSFGSFWATQIAAHSPGLAGTAVWGAVHEPAMVTIFGSASPTFKARFMAMTGQTDEPAFDALAASMDPLPMAPGIRAPYLMVVGEDDELSPVEHSYRLLAAIPAPRDLIVYRGERHSIGGSPAARLGPDPLEAVAEWFVSRFTGEEVLETVSLVDTDGTVATEPLARFLQR